MAMNVNKMLRICLVEMISTSEDNMIRFYNANAVAMQEFLQRAIDDCRRRLRELGHHELVKDEAWDQDKLMHTVRSIVPNATKMFDDLKSDVPPTAVRAKLELWTVKWKEESTRAKRGKDLLAPETLPKRVKTAQDSGPDDGGSSLAGTRRIQRTFYNHLCAHMVVIPYASIKVIKEIGSGSFGTCSQVQIEGVSFFPSTIIYCAKEYKGATHDKLTQFTTEKNMQKMHPSLVRCIACTGEAPWVSIFPYFNGNTVHNMLMWLPFKYSSYRPMIRELTRGARERTQDFRPYDYELARIRGFIENMPHIMHAIVNGMKDAHVVGFVHCDLHTRNICLDFTRDNLCKVGIIDWGLMLLEGQYRPSELYTAKELEDPEPIKDIRRKEGAALQRKRPWMAPELFDPYMLRAFTKASDVYALGYLFLMMVEFWKYGQREFLNSEWTEHPDWRRIYLFEDQITRRMLVDNILERVSLVELDLWMTEKITTEPGRAQRPLVEMSPHF